MTLYSLSGEGGGKFICTSSACVGVWHPLTGTAASSSVPSLGVVKRPDGTVQVTYSGRPLYTFAQDRAPGETNGQGVKDVGTWSVVTITPASTTSAPATTSTPTTTTSESKGGYGY
jgi:predicted lipoprotein with Yx(FWY)xxD motif